MGNFGKEAIQLASGVVLLATILTFATGLLIVNSYLGAYGTFTSDVVRTEYVIVGLTFLLLVGIANVTTWIAIDKLKTSWERAKSRRFWAALGAATEGLVIAVVPLVLILAKISEGRIRISSGALWECIGTLVAFNGYVLNWVNGARTRFANGGGAERKATNPPDTLNSLIAIPLVIGYLATYSQLAYPLIAPVYGGGHRDKVLLVPTERGLQIAKMFSLPLQADE